MDQVAGLTEFELSPGQQAIWMAEQLGVADGAYTTGAFSEIRGNLDIAVFEQAARRVVEQAETLRLRVSDVSGMPRQHVDPLAAHHWRLVVLDLSGAPDPDAAAMEHARDLLEQRFRLDGDEALFRWHLLKLGPELHVWVQTYHHLIVDGFSRQLLREMVADGYCALAQGIKPPAVDLLALKDLLHAPGYGPGTAHWAQDRAHWMGELADRPEPASLAERAETRRRRALCAEVAAPAALRDGLARLAGEAGVGLPTVLTACAASYVGRLTGRGTFMLGWAVSARMGAAARRTPGMMSNLVALRLAVDGQASIGELLTRTARQTRAALRHQRYPTSELRHDLGIAPLAPDPFETIVNVVPYERDVAFAGAVCRTKVLSDGPVFDLEITFRDKGEDGLLLSVFGNADRYAQETLAGHAARLLHHLGQFAEAEPGTRLGATTLMGADERARVLARAAGPVVALDPALTLLSLLDAQRARTPDGLALMFRDQRVTLEELHARADQVAGLLVARGVRPDDIVGVLLERSVEQIVAMLAVLKAGAAVLPLDCSYPAERLGMMVEDASPRLVISLTQQQGLLGTASALCLDDPALKREMAGDPRPTLVAPRPDQLAYVIYTSGSTGRPKGVATAHDAIVNRLLWMQDLLRLSAEDVVLQKTPIGFDVSVWEWLLPLITGARLAITEPDGHRDPVHLLEMIERHGVTVLHFVPSVLSVFLEGLRAGDAMSLRHVVASGEALGGTVREAALRRLPQARLWNLYGPTEAAIDVTFWECRSQPETEATPIGHPIWNTQIHLLDAELQPVPDGQVGELYIAGRNLARGYLGRPDLTAERFIQCPFATQDGAPGGLMYRTGDLARRRSDGEVDFLGRADDQIKLNGLRIEPGEIEAVLIQSFPAQLAQVAVVATSGADRRLVAYAVAQRGAALPEPSEMQARLAGTLPAHMVPQAFVMLESLPLTANGKLDRRALSGIAVCLSRPAFKPPATGLESQLCRLFGEVTGAEVVGADDSFFDLGGDSLSVMRLVSRARATGLALSVAQVLKHQTPAQLAWLLEGGPVAGPLPGTDQAAPVFVLPGAGGDVPMMALLRTRCAASLRLVDLEITDWTELTDPDYRLDRLVARWKAAIVAQAPSGRLRLAGYSLGGQIAWAIAAELAREGRDIEHVLIIDSCSIKRQVQRFNMANNLPARMTLGDELRRVWQRRSDGRMGKECARMVARRLLNPRFAGLLRWMARNRRWLTGWPLLDLDLTVTLFGQHAAAWCDAFDATQRLDAPVTLLRAQDTADPDWDLGWHATTPKLRVVPVTGDHLTLLSVERVDTVAANLIQVFGR